MANQIYGMSYVLIKKDVKKEKTKRIKKKRV